MDIAEKSSEQTAEPIQTLDADQVGILHSSVTASSSYAQLRPSLSR